MRKFDHVIILGIDGAGHFFREANTHNFDRIFLKDGAYTYDGLSSNPSISAQAWGSMMTGVSPALHGLTNDIMWHHTYPEDSPYPTFYRRIWEAYPRAELGAFCEWLPLIRGLIERQVPKTACVNKDYLLVEPICYYIQDKKPDLLFVHCDSVDHAGHANGYGTEPYMQAIEKVDQIIGKIYDAVVAAGIADSTLFIVISDHGGTCDPAPEGTGFVGSHGGWTVNERYITFAARGNGVCKGSKIGPLNIRDVAAVVQYAFDLPMPEFDLNCWTSQLPTGLFEGISPEYRDISEEENAAPAISQFSGTSTPL